MELTMIAHPRLQVRAKTGAEGPRHDPYSFREYHVTIPHGCVVLHEGLGTWLTFNRHRIEPPKGLSWEKQETWLRTDGFRELVGYSIEQLERMHRKLNARCPKCSGKQFHTESGYPGETFEVCDCCNHIMQSYFNRSAIE